MNQNSRLEDLLAGLPALVFGYIGGAFGYVISTDTTTARWFQWLLVATPCVIAGLFTLLNTWMKGRQAIELKSARLPHDPRSRRHS